MIRAVIVREIRRRRWSAYRAAHESGLAVRTVQQFIAGSSDLASERLSVLCRALNLELRPVRRRNRG